MNKLNSKNWQRVRINKTDKCITFTNESTYKTMTACQSDIKSSQYIAINLKAFNKLLSDGYTVNDSNTQANTENAVQVNCEAVKPIEKVGVKQVKVDPIKLFLATPPRQKTEHAFDYSKQWERYEKKGKPRAEKALENQLAEYR